ncbi:hypothetical protein FEM03_12460 [Phragmitibacter flavus]|uniref:Uncharacterized protein n=1 Tax=Phragmitibacter flavus TaxID=2576071 RepID=A0A5R8KE15_9BACT|nr:hypothetical protein [Phragmitibacter flavus]TLD70531.1 hypothetical protein FEM03_12460 [Phragmitibacter flavus]
MRSIYTLAAFLIVLSLCEARGGEKATVMLVESALGKLALRGSEKHPWAVFTDSPSDKFVQFGFEQNILFIDIPLVGKSDEEKKKIARVFRSIGVARPIQMESRDPKTLKSTTIQTYQADFEKDPKNATDFALRIFHEVYEIRTPTLTVDEGSG